MSNANTVNLSYISNKHFLFIHAADLIPFRQYLNTVKKFCKNLIIFAERTGSALLLSKIDYYNYFSHEFR